MAQHSEATYRRDGGSQLWWAGNPSEVLSEMAAAVTHNSDSQLNRYLVEAPG